MKLSSSKAVKAAAVILLIVSMLTALVSAAAALIMEGNSAYKDGGVWLRQQIAESVFQWNSSVLQNYAYVVLQGDGDDIRLKSYQIQTARENCNLSVQAVEIETGKTLYQNYETGPYSYTFSTACHYYDEMLDRPVEAVEITAYLQEDLSAKDGFYYALSLADFCIAARYVLIWVAVGTLLFSLLLIVFLLCAAGHRRGTEGIYLRGFDRLPLEIVATAYFFLFMFTLSVWDSFIFGNDALTVFFIIAGIVWSVLFIELLTTLAVRLKAKTFWKNTLTWRLLKLLGRGARLLWHVLLRLPLFWKTAVGFLLWSAFELFFLALGGSEYLVSWLFTRPILLALLVWLVLMMRRLQKAGQQLSAGNTDFRVDTSYMPPDLKKHGENLNNLSEGLNRAVEERMRSERMKAELITNVSHDIKTPLTSIINYVDLLKVGGLDSPDAPGYLEILEQQSARLKKLTEDLIEASKASSGSMPWTPAPTDVNVLLSQALGEHEEALRAAGIEPILRLAEENPVILADGRLLWRVFDNLITNIRKYAQPSTRAYFTSQVDGGRAVITFRNISAEPLAVSGEELTERFVRGDSSRHTEGSGLGLSIARSLTELQGGEFAVSIDGDLFKATVRFPLI